MDEINIQKIIVLAFTGLYLISYLLPAYSTGVDILPGHECAAIVVMEMHEIFTNLAVFDVPAIEYISRLASTILTNLANPIILITVITYLKKKPLGHWTFILLILSTISVFYWVFYTGFNNLGKLKIGYWLWSLSIFSIGIIIAFTKKTYT